MNSFYARHSQAIVFLLWLAAIVLLGWNTQNHLLMNSDVSWFMHAADRLLSGGTYAKDYFEVNPPLTIYLSIPPVLLAKSLGLENQLASRIYIFVIGLVSLFVCHRLLGHIVSQTNKTFHAVFLLVLAAIYFMMPLSDLGQREHLLVMLTMPYFLLAASRIEAYQPVTLRLALVTGIMAGIGFAIKPFFYAPFIMVECYLATSRRSRASRMRTETIAVLCVLAAYIAVIGLFHRDYLTDILPFITQYYYQSYSSSLSLLIFNHNTYFIVLAILTSILSLQKSDQQVLLNILMCATIGFFISYLMQRTHWYYHIYPMLALSTLLIAMSLSELMKRYLDFDTAINLSIISAMVLAYFCYHFSYLTQMTAQQTTSYFSVFFSIFAYLFYIASPKKSLLKMTALLTIIFYIAFIFYENINLSIWNHWLFSACTLLLFLLFALLIPAKETPIKLQFIFYSFIGTLFLAYPFYQVSYIYNGNIAYKNLYQNLLADLNKYPHQTLAFLTDSAEFAFPAVDYTHQSFASRFGALGGLPVLRYDDADKNYEIAYLRNKYKMDFITSAVASDIERYRPEMILVDRREADKKRKLGYFGNNQMNYIKLFTINSHFARVWKDYHYVATIDGQPLYRFEIYMKNAAV